MKQHRTLASSLLCASLSLLLLATSCQSPSAPPPTGHFQILKAPDKPNPAQAHPHQRKSLVPKDMLYIHGDPNELFPEGIPAPFEKLPRHVENPGFQTQALPVPSYGCQSNCGVYDLSVNMNYPTSPHAPSSGSINLSNATSYGYGIHVVGTGTNAAGQQIATALNIGYAAAVSQPGQVGTAY
ncbi:MAG: hypothetical protein CVV27_04595, partial [Candidatus Melainabacteria bacterium HGW-Melainabacteria-1]